MSSIPLSPQENASLFLVRSTEFDAFTPSQKHLLTIASNKSFKVNGSLAKAPKNTTTTLNDMNMLYRLAEQKSSFVYNVSGVIFLSAKLCENNKFIEVFKSDREILYDTLILSLEEFCANFSISLNQFFKNKGLDVKHEIFFEDKKPMVRSILMLEETEQI